jgi:hypothetical protein
MILKDHEGDEAAEECRRNPVTTRIFRFDRRDEHGGLDCDHASKIENSNYQYYWIKHSPNNPQ